jgi:thioredoxin-like negative regulator of GroEL
MAQHGGKRPGAGRKPGAVSKAKRELAEMAKDHAEMALGVLAEIAGNKGEAASARVTAANSILDRAYGKPFSAEPEQDEESEAVTWQISVRAAKGQIRVTQPERAASDLSEGA